VAGQFSGIAVQASFDNEMTWHGYQIDTGSWANGTMFEVEPAVVLFVYGGWNSPSQLRYQFLRVTKAGLAPIREELFQDNLIHLKTFSSQRKDEKSCCKLGSRTSC